MPRLRPHNDLEICRIMNHRFTFILDDDELKEATVNAWYKPIKGTNPVGTLVVLLAFQQMRAHPIPEARRIELEARYDESTKDAKAVQPELLEEEI